MKRTVRCMCVLILLLTLLGSFRAVPVQAAPPIIVTEATDGPDQIQGDGICSDGVNGCTLRAAIQEAFTNSGAASIEFSEALTGSTIYLDNVYGTLVWAGSNISVDGSDRNITISGLNLSGGMSVFQIQGSHNTLAHVTVKDSGWDGVQVGDFTGVGEGNSNILNDVTVVHSAAGGVYIHGSGSGGHDNQVNYSYIGTISGGNICASQYANGYDGIYIDGGVARTSLVYNRIVCNLHNGVFINGTSGGAIDGTTIGSSYIGTDGSGTMGNGWNGIHLINATNTQIGGSTISGNNQAGLSSDSRAGIWLEISHNNSIRNNSIGTNAVGTYSLGNLGEGLLLSNGSTGNIIGNDLNPNTISGNGGSGVSLETAAYQNTLNNNRIGLNQAATAAIPNGLAGVAIIGADNNTIGSADSTVNQYISGNTREGIYITGSNSTYVGSRTMIGRGVDGVTPLGNGLEGIMLTGSSSYSNILAGSIVWNGKAGLAIVGDASVGNNHRVGKVFANGNEAVDLDNDGHTANGTHSGPPGPNNWLRYPVISSVGVHSLSGTACPACQVHLYLAYGNPVAIGGGGTWLKTALADDDGIWVTTLPDTVSPAEVTLVACDESAGGDCSEMSPLYSGTLWSKVFLPLVIRSH